MADLDLPPGMLVVPGKRWFREQRCCMWYYGDGGCLDMAARVDLKEVPCVKCNDMGGIIWPRKTLRRFRILGNGNGRKE